MVGLAKASRMRCGTGDGPGPSNKTSGGMNDGMDTSLAEIKPEV
jgi:hypothetical protein